MTWFFSPDLSNAFFPYLQPVFIAELAAMLWLLIVGAKERKHVEPITRSDILSL